MSGPLFFLLSCFGHFCLPHTHLTHYLLVLDDSVPCHCSLTSKIPTFAQEGSRHLPWDSSQNLGNVWPSRCFSWTIAWLLALIDTRQIFQAKRVGKGLIWVEEIKIGEERKIKLSLILPLQLFWEVKMNVWEWSKTWFMAAWGGGSSSCHPTLGSQAASFIFWLFLSSGIFWKINSFV